MQIIHTMDLSAQEGINHIDHQQGSDLSGVLVFHLKKDFKVHAPVSLLKLRV